MTRFIVGLKQEPYKMLPSNVIVWRAAPQSRCSRNRDSRGSHRFRGDVQAPKQNVGRGGRQPIIGGLLEHRVLAAAVVEDAVVDPLAVIARSGAGAAYIVELNVNFQMRHNVVWVCTLVCW